VAEQILPNYLATAQNAYAFGQQQGAQKRGMERESRLASLAQQAYGAAPEQRDALLQQAVGVDPDAGLALSKGLRGEDDAREQALLNTARMIDGAPVEMKDAIFQQVRPRMAQYLPNLPETYSPQVEQGIKAFIASRGGGARDVKVVGNSLVDSAGNVVYQAPQRYLTAQGLIEVGPDGVRELRVGANGAPSPRHQVIGPDGRPLDLSGITDPRMRDEIAANPALWQVAPDGGEVQMPEQGGRILPASSIAQEQQMALAREAASRADRADARSAEAAERARRAEEIRARFGTIPPGFRVKADGSGLEPVPGGPKPAGAAATEGERKSATLLRRMEGSLAQLNSAVKESPSSASPSVVAEIGRSLPLIGDIAANTLNTSERQRVEAAQLDILDAALTLGTGAAYTKEQLQGYRKSFFPQLGDTQETIEEKAARLQNVIEAARIAAGRAAPQGGGGKYQVGQVIEVGGKRYRVTGGDPNDPDVEEL
jgi:hypothetical protein